MTRISKLAVAARGAAMIGVVALVATTYQGPGTGPDVRVVETTAPSGDDGLASRIDQLLTNPVFNGSTVEVVVRDATTGDVVYDRAGDQRVNPASNMKLFTSTAAMATLGPSFRFHTDVYAKGRVHGHTLAGRLYLKGFGDPTTLRSDYVRLARQVVAAGITSVRGALVADDSYFDDVRLGTGWSWDDEPYYYSAQTSALTVAPNTDYDSGTVIVESTPAATVGRPVRIRLVPKTSVLRVVNDATTGAPGSDYTLDVVRAHGSNVVHVTGSLPTDAGTDQEWVTVWNPTRYAADVFERALRANGVSVAGPVRTGTTPAGSVIRVARDRSMPLSGILIPFLKLSNNMHAEALVKTMGAVETGVGSWDAGLNQVIAYAQGKGVHTDTLAFYDGSGLSRMDLLTGDAITDLLGAVRGEPWFGTWYNALPIAGNPDRFVGGTLRSRMVGTPAANNVHAKTGSLTGVSALSGYVTDADGRKLVFSMVTNAYLDSPRSVEDALAVTLASWTADGKAAPVSPSRMVPTRRLPVTIECSWAKAC